MKRLITAMTLAAALTLVMAPAALAGGQTADKLQDAGWNCFTAGPNNWTHCVNPATGGNAGQATNVKVFSESENGSEFLGTEILLSAKAYHGQPCATDGGAPYHDLGTAEQPGPFACHHFSTHG